MVEIQGPLPPAPPKPSFANRIKIKLEYNDLKSQFYQVTNLKESLFHDLSEKQAKEFNLILDQIELIRSRMPISDQPQGRAEGGDDWELRRVRKYQENPGGGFMYESDEDLIRGRSSASLHPLHQCLLHNPPFFINTRLEENKSTYDTLLL
ncbi:uncharacterized protein PGTG_14639 [Puccinia graminis f. sp. tritici CRL 75-36-700-3]|uniref:Uncharacterized protein n=1 Tax=Puccinia graminis f. sp. tritici (strain CRL 75-36-700-3 / race SCCL) TaxID=418459 RepID=E3KWK6_PUCGT|nr:uncharacterized protein PGTG_14639 [Puccinia graminis f. sp. tritici CRL 75-36-700-3]EFP88673.1 hypothetical protein PGTG_14639 [Puccinia graminis f. sp. tritici CRL 75-36-700-3]